MKSIVCSIAIAALVAGCSGNTPTTTQPGIASSSVTTEMAALRSCPPPPVCPAPPDAAVCAPPVVCPAPPPAVVCQAPIPGSVVGWVPCAKQGDTCQLPSGAVKIRYGGTPNDGPAGGNLDLPFAAGSTVHCDIDTFGAESQRLFHAWSPNLACPWCGNFCWYEGEYIPAKPIRPVTGPAIALPLPIAYPGSSQPRVRPTDDIPNPQTGESNTVGAFRVSCGFANFTWADPTDHDAGYLSVVFGNTGVTDSSTSISIGSTGSSTCDGGSINRSMYGVPAMLNCPPGQPCTAIQPSENVVYYKTGYNGIAPAAVQPVPPGLVMAVGSPDNIAPAGNATTRYACLRDPHQDWSPNIPTACSCTDPNGCDLVMAVEFPQCWDGVNLDSLDHRSHMSWTVDGACPATHPVPIPAIAYNVHYATNGNATQFWQLSSDNYDVSDGRAGYSGYGTYIYGWDPETFRRFTANCLNADADCHADLIGEGLTLF